MTLPNIPQSASTAVVRKHSLVLIDLTNNNTQDLTVADTKNLIAEFKTISTPQIWDNWLARRRSVSCKLQSPPQLIRTI